MAVVAGKIAGYVVVEQCASGVRLVNGGVHDDRVLAMQEAYRRHAVVAVPPSTFTVYALVEVDAP